MLSSSNISGIPKPSISRSRSHRVLCIVAMMFALVLPLRAQKYDVILLGSLGGQDPTPYGLNEKTEVVGYSYTPGNLLWHAFRWKNGAMSDLSGAVYSMAFRINEKGSYVGYTYDLGFTVRHAHVWGTGINLDIDQSGGKNSIAAAINDSGVVVGSFQDTTSKEIHTFRWENGVFTDMGKLGGEGFSGALGINNAGQMIGNYDRLDIVDSVQSKYVHGFFYENGGSTDMGPLVYPEEINDKGEATGYYYPDIQQTYTWHAFLWKNGVLTDIGSLGTGHTQAHGISDSGEVVGWTFNQAGRDVAFSWKNGVMTDLNTQIDSNSGWYLRTAYAVNNHGQIVGVGQYAGIEHFAFLLTPKPLTITNPAAGAKWFAGDADTIRWKDAPSGGVTISFSRDGGASYTTIADNVVSDSNYYAWKVPHKRTTSARIAVTALADPWYTDTSDAFSIEDFAITRPIQNQRWISGQRDTVRWSHGAKGDLLNISLSKDSGGTYTVIGSNIPADSGYYSWSIPESTLSVDCFIKLTLASDPSVDTTSRRFRIKGYQLTRFTTSGKYEAFSPSIHGWQYQNGTLWPRFWWSQFQYKTANDPNTNSAYPPFIQGVSDSVFVDWPLWTRVFSTDSCYWSTFFGIYRQRALDKWKIHAFPHNGSCFGFAASSFLGFNFKPLLLYRHPGIHDFTNLATVPLSDSIRQAINSYYTYQFGTQSYLNDATGQHKDVRTTLQEIRTMFITDATNIQTITIYNSTPPGGAHTMAPYKLSKDNSGPSRYRLLLYDSNNPLVNTPYILIDSLNNTWADKTGLGASWAGTDHFYLEIPIINYFYLPAMGKASPDITDEIKATANIEFYNTSKANAVYSASDGKKISFVNGTLTNEISSAVAIFNKDGSVSDPIGYYVPDDAYSLTLSDFAEPGGPVYLTAFKGNIVYCYDRNGAGSSQVDRFRIDSALSVGSGDAAGKTINLHVVIDRPGDERIFFARNIPMQINDSLRIHEVGENRLIVENFAGAKSYDLEIDTRSSSKQDATAHLAIPIGGNSRQIIEPDWGSLGGSAVNILIDNGNDGTIDDSITVSNQMENIHVRSSWNMVSIPRTLPDYRTSALFPSALSAAYAYTPLGYAAKETLRNGQGYWLKFSSGQSIPVVGDLRISDTISLNPGWNMIGSISSAIPVAGIASIPGGIVTSSFFGYDSAYSSADSIRPGRGYWVKVNQSGQLVLSTSEASPSTRIRIVPTTERPPVPPGGEIQHPAPTGGGQLPTTFALDQNFPNPFNPRTTITYELPKASYVTLKVYDVFGREVATLADGMEDAGYKSVNWDAVNLATGVYFYKLQAGDFIATKKLLLMK